MRSNTSLLKRDAHTFEKGNTTPKTCSRMSPAYSYGWKHFSCQIALLAFLRKLLTASLTL
jgi:hypothetical protein